MKIELNIFIKKILLGISYVSCLFFAYAQEVTNDIPEEKLFETKYYRVVSYTANTTSSIQDDIDKIYDMFNTVFHFINEDMNFLFPIVLFDSEDEYKNYVSEKTGGNETNAHSVYLRYNNAEKSEVVSYADNLLSPLGIRQLFLQYLTYFLPNYPQWLFGGYALQFENSMYQENP